MDAPAFKYWAFISYSHADSAWADWLHGAIETYSVPARLRRASKHAGRQTNGQAEAIPRHLYPVFRDRDELASSSDLSTRIREALAQSRCLIVICSPRAAASRWVEQEIRAFRELGRADRVLALIVDGEPGAAGGKECFPPALREGEPLAADARPEKDTRETARLRLIAGILGVGFEELRQRERQRVLRQRLRTAASVLAAVAAMALVYVGIADKGLDLPGGARLRQALDHYGLSVFRPVESEAAIEQSAGAAEAGMIARMDREWRAGDWLRPNPTRTNGAKMAISPWVTSQAMWGAFAAVGHASSELPDFLAVLDAPFAPDLLIEANGKKFGWLVSDADFPQADPALWTVAAIAEAVGRGDLIDVTQRQHFLSRLAYAQQAADTYRPTPDGGWNVFPQQDDPNDHTTYATSLALLALLELHHAGLDWEGDPGKIDILLRASATWLAGQFDARGDPPGWHAESGRGPVVDGLTLPLYAELLRCEEEAGVPLPPVILAAIPGQIDRLLGRAADYPIATASYTRIFTNFDGVRVTRWQDVSFPWLPGAIDLTTRWLRRLDRTGAAPEQKLQTERVLGYLVVDLGAQSFPDIESGKAPIYFASETLHALATAVPEH